MADHQLEPLTSTDLALIATGTALFVGGLMIASIVKQVGSSATSSSSESNSSKEPPQEPSREENL